MKICPACKGHGFPPALLKGFKKTDPGEICDVCKGEQFLPENHAIFRERIEQARQRLLYAKRWGTP